jgi:hypothetical protein
METWLEDDAPAQLPVEARHGAGERVLEQAEDFRRLTAPLRALGQAVVDGRNRMRRGRRSEWDRADDGESRDPAAAI